MSRNKYWIDPNPDLYGKDRLISKINNLGFNATNDKGVVIAYASKEDFNKALNLIAELVSKIGYSGSWGVRVEQTTKSAKKTVELWD